MDSCAGDACLHLPHEGACDDGIDCTVTDACTGGNCAGKPLDAVCEDGFECTIDVCQAGKGCVHDASPACAGCVGLTCMPCSIGQKCSDKGPFLETTCCAAGDPVAHLGYTQNPETLAVAVADGWLFACNTFGLRVASAANPTDMVWSKVGGGCTEVVFGPPAEGSKRRVYATWREPAFLNQYLAIYDLDIPSGGVTWQSDVQELGVDYDGVLATDDVLYVAAHGAGLRVYALDEVGGAALVSVASGAQNPWRVTRFEDFLYVADGDAGLAVFALETETVPTWVQTLPTSGVARDLVVSSGQLFVANGSAGVDVFSLTNPAKPKLITTLPSYGSAQALSASGGHVAVANWNHIDVYESATHKLHGSEKLVLFPDLEQDLDITFVGSTLYVTEWKGVHVLALDAGKVAPNIWIGKDILEFKHDTGDTKGFIVENRGQTALVVSSITTSDPAHFTASPTKAEIPPGGEELVQVTYTPPVGPSAPGGVEAKLVLATNVPDSTQSPFELALNAKTSAGSIDLGDPIPMNKFGFLVTDPAVPDPFLGHVTVIAYFALF